MAKRVLVADDSATIQKAFAMVFGGQDVSLIAARSLEEAISAARQGRPDLVIADANLGGRTGYELCSAVKSDPGLRGIPVYILASTHNPYDEGRGREAGADGHLQKPFESQGIIDRVSEILGQAPAPMVVPQAAPSVPVAIRAPSSPAPAAPFAASAAKPAPAAVGARPTRRDDDDDYGEVTIERAPAPIPAPAPLPSARPLAASLAAQAGTAPGLRPSLIPGAVPGARPGFPARPAGAVPPAGGASAPALHPARPGVGWPTPPGGVAAGGPMAPPTSPPSATATPPISGAPLAAPAPAASAGVGRTMMGMPAVMIPGVPPRATTPGAPAPTPGMAPARSPGLPSPSITPPVASASAASLGTASPPVASATAPSPSAAAAVSARLDQKLDQKIGAFAARGPEYEAIAKLSREVIEEIVWEVVPELAEIIIREHVERLAAAKK